MIELLKQSMKLGFLLFSFAVSTVAQTTPAITFTVDFPGSDPPHYVLSISSDGRSTYQSTAAPTVNTDKPDTDSADTDKSDSDKPDTDKPAPPVPIRQDFVITQKTTTRIFDLARRANYFEGDIDSRRKVLASTGTKTLAYHDATRTSQATYNYSPSSVVQELTELLENISATLEFGRRLDYDLRYQKLALEEQLSTMENAMSKGSLAELQAIAPVLQQIADDSTVINISRARAQRLLALSKAAKP